MHPELLRRRPSARSRGEARSRAAAFIDLSLDICLHSAATRADDVPALPGAYVLAVELSRPIRMTVANRPASLAAGRYLYCGSAKGPGGLRARIARHMRHGKPMRWHIDHLTEAGRVLGAWTFVGGSECELVAALAHLPMPVEDFGSSDCRRCTSHLLRWADSVHVTWQWTTWNEDSRAMGALRQYSKV